MAPPSARRTSDEPRFLSSPSGKVPAKVAAGSSAKMHWRWPGFHSPALLVPLAGARISHSTDYCCTLSRTMPELPEVETSRAYVEQFCRGSIIKSCVATEQGGGPRDGLFDELVMGEEMSAEKVASALEGRTIVALKRRGKQMWFVLDKPPHPLFHFGMTGAFTVKGERRHNFVKFSVGEEWPPRFTKLELQMSNGACLVLTDPRRLSRVRLRTEPEASPPISLLGPDPITDPIPLDTFAAALAKPTAPIKAVLLAQDRVVSGVGNWVADEVCFQAAVHPGAACNTLSPEQVGALHTKLLSICRQACDARADYTVFPKDWLFHHRWGKGKGSETPRVSSGHAIHFDVVGGRTTAIVLAIQQKGLLAGSSARNTCPPAKGGKENSKVGSRAGKKKVKDEHETEGRDVGGPHQKKASAPSAASSTNNGRGERGRVAVAKTGGSKSTSKSATGSGKPKGRKRGPSKPTAAAVKHEPVKARKSAAGKARTARKPAPKAAAKVRGGSVKPEAPAAAAGASTKRGRGEEGKAVVAETASSKRIKRANKVKTEGSTSAKGAAIAGGKGGLVTRKSPRLAS